LAFVTTLLDTSPPCRPVHTHTQYSVLLFFFENLKRTFICACTFRGRRRIMLQNIHTGRSLSKWVFHDVAAYTFLFGLRDKFDFIFFYTFRRHDNNVLGRVCRRTLFHTPPSTTIVSARIIRVCFFRRNRFFPLDRKNNNNARAQRYRSVYRTRSLSLWRCYWTRRAAHVNTWYRGTVEKWRGNINTFKSNCTQSRVRSKLV